jgi:hypothetical protein
VSDDREHDGQPTPAANDRSGMHDVVIALMRARKELGLKKYQTILQPFNGRDALLDLRDELLDAVVYVTQEIEERREAVALAARVEADLAEARAEVARLRRALLEAGEGD